MKRILTFLCIAMLTLSPFIRAMATDGAGNPCAEHKKGRKAAAKPTALGHPAEDNYDIKHLLFNMNMTDTSTYVQGNVATSAVVTSATMSEYVFELGTTLTIDSARVNGIMLPVTSSGVIRTIILPITLTTGSLFTAHIWYHGMPPAGSGFFNGITHSVSGGGTHMVFTLSDPWVALNWWPCKQSILDQADSVDMHITVPEGVVSGSNGKLVNVDMTTNPGYSTYHWKTNYPIDYYLICMSIARYSEYKNYMHFTGSTDTMLLQNFFMDTAGFIPAHKAKFDSAAQIIDFYSSLIGRYPFWKEKYGMCFTSLPGGMEHQTMTTIGVTTTTTIAHEIMHQWFGDHVTYRSWRDMWLSEGFATFSEHLFVQHFYGDDAARAYRTSQLTRAISKTCGMTYVTDTSGSDSLFTSNQYEKAAIFINTLRYMAPHDSLFFKVLRAYQSTYSFSNAVTADFQAIAESIYGFSLDTFFNQWVYGRGFPIYKTTWNQIGNKVYVKLMQSQSCPSYTNHFSTPVQLQLKAGSIDTFIKVYNSIDTQTYSFDWTPTMTGLSVNPDIWTVMRNIGVAKDATLKSVGVIQHNDLRIHPNPTEDNWRIDALPEDTGLALMDLTGKVIWEGKSSKGITVVPGAQLPSGTYLLQMNGASSEHVKLVKW